MITLNKLMAAMPSLPRTKAELYFPHLKSAMESQKIDTLLREAAFLAQVAHESIDLRYMEEIASGSAYEGRKDLGNTEVGDGIRYKGRGPIQLTGRLNYREFGKALGVDFESSPALAATPEWGFKTAVLYWARKHLNELADLGDMKTITKKINGGYNGLEDRMRRYELAKKVLK